MLANCLSIDLFVGKLYCLPPDKCRGADRGWRGHGLRDEESDMSNTEPQEGVKPQPLRRAMRRKTQLALTVAAKGARMPQNAGQANDSFFQLFI